MLGRIIGSSSIRPMEHYRPSFSPESGHSVVLPQGGRRVSNQGNDLSERPNRNIGPRAVTGTECKTCKNRRYQDVSDDPGVSMKFATSLNPEAAASAVRGHEGEHVVRELSKAEDEDRQAIASVVLSTEICPECGRVYLAGGTTKVTSWSKKADPALSEGLAVLKAAQ